MSDTAGGPDAGKLDKLWETLIRPELPNFRSMQELQEGQQPPAETSVWHANWRVPKQG